jgi:hypothetical protein
MEVWRGAAENGGGRREKWEKREREERRLGNLLTFLSYLYFSHLYLYLFIISFSIMAKI